MKTAVLGLLAVVVLVGCGERTAVVTPPKIEIPEIVKPVEKVAPPVDVVETNLNPSSTSEYVTYTNDTYGFSVSHPKGWAVEQHKASSISGAGPGLSCEDAPVEDCPLDSFRFSRGTHQDGEISGLNITLLEKGDPLTPQQKLSSEWLVGIALGCKHTKSVNSTEYEYVLYAFQGSSRENAVASQKMCDAGVLGEISQGMFESFIAF